MENNQQQWFPLWMELVKDAEARHYHRMKNAVWLFLYLLSGADRRSGFLACKIETIGSETGIKRDTIIRWLNVLRKGGYITTRNTGRGLFIQIRQWGNPLPDIAERTQQVQETPDTCGEKSPTAGMAHFSQNEPKSNKKPGSPIDISITNNKYNIDIDKKASPDSLLKGIAHFKPRNRQQLLACDLARELYDPRGLPFYLSCTKKYPEPLIRKILGQVKEVPSAKIIKSRAALFNHMIQQYDQEDS
jgi:hypothetical protein